jgi:hypothetical protein
MNTILRTSVCAGALAVAFAGLELTTPGWIGELGPALAEFYEQRARLDREQRLARQLVEEEQRLHEKAACKKSVLNDLLADRISLWEAAERFRALEMASPMRCPLVFASFYPGNSDEERFCRQIIAQVAVELENRPDNDRVLIQTLMAQLEEALSCGCIPSLPN